ncbi:MAG: serine hydrolase [Halobacteriaceae archaeon]
MRVNANRKQEQAEYSLARHTKLLGSAVFVVGRNPYEYIENDLRTLNHYHDWDTASIEINHDNPSVTVSTNRGISKTAIYHESLGCTLLPEDESDVYFDPINIKSELDDPTTMEWPMGSQNATAHNPSDVDRKTLSRTLDQVTSTNPPQGMPSDTRAIVVLKEGKIVGERYASGYNKNTQHVSWSMGKSVTSALIGILIEEGHFDVDDPAPIDAWRDDPRSQITISDLLRMSSGLDFRRSTDEKDTVPCVKEDHHHRVYYDPIDIFEFVTGRSLELNPNTE